MRIGIMEKEGELLVEMETNNPISHTKKVRDGMGEM